jgi:hypothetical protein
MFLRSQGEFSALVSGPSKVRVVRIVGVMGFRCVSLAIMVVRV